MAIDRIRNLCQCRRYRKTTQKVFGEIALSYEQLFRKTIDDVDRRPHSVGDNVMVYVRSKKYTCFYR